MNLRDIDATKEQWALEHSKQTNTVVTSNDLAHMAPLKYDNGILKCPLGGIYRLGRIGEPPTCTVPGHSLP